MSGAARSDAEEGPFVVCSGLSDALRGGSLEERIRIAGLTSLGGAQPLLSEGQRVEGSNGRTGTTPGLLWETDSDQRIG